MKIFRSYAQRKEINGWWLLQLSGSWLGIGGCRVGFGGSRVGFRYILKDLRGSWEGSKVVQRLPRQMGLILGGGLPTGPYQIRKMEQISV